MDDEKEGGSDEDCCDSAGSLSDEAVFAPGKPPGAGEDRLFWEEETKSRFTEYSMTSSVMRRNEQLTLHDERFEKVRFPADSLLVLVPSKFYMTLDLKARTCSIRKSLRSLIKTDYETILVLILKRTCISPKMVDHTS